MERRHSNRWRKRWRGFRDTKSNRRCRLGGDVERDMRWYTSVVSFSSQVVRFPSELSAFLELTAVSPRERQRVHSPTIMYSIEP